MNKTLMLYQPKDGYCYNSDTIFLYDFIINKKIKKNSQVLEVGCGCGVLGMLVKRDVDIELTQIEIQDIFYKLACKNTQINNINSHILQKDFLDFSSNGKYDYVISNPPYYHSGVLKSENKHLNICKIQDSLPMDKFFSKVAKILAPKGKFIFCYSAILLQDILSNLKNVGLNVENIKFVYPKENKNATLVLIYAQKNSKTLMSVENSLIVFQNEVFSKNVLNIYKNANTYTIKCQI